MPDVDVAIIGGGPGGTTLGSFLRKYDPALRVLIVEKEQFPREHIGESQLPPISRVLQEIDCWNKVEQARFPIKVGATYTWGRTVDPWVFGFMGEEQIPQTTERPGRYEGWRQQAAFQVDRAVYDEILLRHAAEMGCEVREKTSVRQVLRSGDRVDGLVLSSGDTVTARYYVDASGNAAILRRALGVQVHAPTLLRNVAFWQYWEKDEWAQRNDVDICRIHIRSVPFGWIWHIRLSPTRFSTGLVCPAEYFKNCGMRPDALYFSAVRGEAFVARDIEGATCTGDVRGTTDWSFVVDRTYGENWFLVGECAGFADPILSAGLTLAQTGARELAYTILELDRGEHARDWLLERFDELQIRRVRQHMRFAEFWYSANGIFEDIRENCTRIAADAGFTLNAAEAFRWLSFGGLCDDVPGQAGIGGLDLAGVKQVMARLTGGQAAWSISGKNVFKLNLAGAREVGVGLLESGRIRRVRCWMRGDKRLPEVGMQGKLISLLEHSEDINEILAMMSSRAAQELSREHATAAINHAMQALESMVVDHWVLASTNKRRPALDLQTPVEGAVMYTAAARPGARGSKAARGET